MHTLSSAEKFEAQRSARAELMIAFTHLLGEPEARAAKLCFVEAAKEYLAGDAELDAHRNRAARVVLERRNKRALLLQALQMVAGDDRVTMRVLDTLVRHVGQFLQTTD
jgi:hypothetical protein